MKRCRAGSQPAPLQRLQRLSEVKMAHAAQAQKSIYMPCEATELEARGLSAGANERTRSRNAPNITFRSKAKTASRPRCPKRARSPGFSTSQLSPFTIARASPAGATKPHLVFPTTAASSESASADTRSGFPIAMMPSSFDGKKTFPVFAFCATNENVNVLKHVEVVILGKKGQEGQVTEPLFLRPAT